MKKDSWAHGWVEYLCQSWESCTANLKSEESGPPHAGNSKIVWVHGGSSATLAITGNREAQVDQGLEETILSLSARPGSPAQPASPIVVSPQARRQLRLPVHFGSRMTESIFRSAWGLRAKSKEEKEGFVHFLKVLHFLLPILNFSLQPVCNVSMG